MAVDVVRVTDAGGLIDPALFPKASGALGMEWAQQRAGVFRTTGQQVADNAQDIHSAWSRLPESYQAPEAGDLYRAMDPALGAALREQEKFLDAARYLEDYVDEVGAVQPRLASLEAEAGAFRARVRAANPGGVTTMLLQELDTVDQNQDLIVRAQQVFAVILEAEQRCADRIKALDEQTVPVTKSPVPALTGRTGLFSSTGAWSPVDSPRVADFAPTKTILDGSASEVREWWGTLTPQQRTALVAAMPMVVGNLNGVPVKFRADANRINLATEIDRLEAEKARIEKELRMAAMASRFSALGGGYIPDLGLAKELDRLQAAIDSYEHYRSLPEGGGQYEYDKNGRRTYRDTVELVAFDPTRLSIATYRGPYDRAGDVPDWVDNVAVHVPGTTTRMDDFNETDTDAYNLYDEAHNTVGAGSTAVFAWAGGEFPQNIPEAASASYSRDLGPKLRDFMHAIDVHPDSTLTAEAHSYGGAVLGIAESEGLRVDRVMYVAGAGLGNDNTSVQDFPYTKDVPHYTQMARRDSVVGLIQGADAGELGHGASALHDPDVTRLETGYLNAANRSQGDIESTGVFESHSSVYTKGSTAFNNIVGVITGTRVEAYAQDEVYVAGGTLYNIDGIDVEGYEPRYFDVE
ncbi:alpha/beta hydrolase [Promicromonospora sp. NPDC023987]|uniref:alpha/beta hydrolase n=1 Tax=Promicromonospora sp. NPDC023987 TaxID=3155360 RepID=UPI0033EF7206